MHPSQSLATLRPDLSGSLQEFDLQMAAQGFISHEVMPPFEVQVAAGVFGRIPIEQLLQSLPTLRAPGSDYNRSKWTFEPDSYVTQEHGTEEPIDDNEAQMYADYFDVEVISSQRARRTLMESEERETAALIQNASAYNTLGITDEWDDSDSAIPVDDVNGAIDRLWAKGIIANALILTRKQYRSLRVCEQVREILSSSGAGNRTTQQDIGVEQLKLVFDLPQIKVAGGIKNINDAGLDGSFTGIWSDEYAGVTRIATTRDIREPCFGRTFHWGLDGSTIGGALETYRDERVRGNIVRARHQRQKKVLYAAAMELLSNAITI